MTELLKFADLYGMEVLHTHLLNQGFNNIAHREKTIPNDGSPCYCVAGIHKKKEVSQSYLSSEVIRTITHKDGSITVQTALGFFRYLKI